MQLERIETPGISHYAYILSDDGEAAVVDPGRDVAKYLGAANRHGARIRYILETHRQEDFESGSTHLRELTGASVVNGQHDCFGRGDIRLGDRETLALGNLMIRALHTPGHTPESMCYVVYPEEAPARAWGVFTGDSLFYGDTGRTDLPGRDKQRKNAGVLYDVVHEKLATLHDGTLVLPAHGPGSVCGSGMADRSISTLGAEKQYNKVFTLSRESFVDSKGEERLPRPPYFEHMEEVNLKGGRPLPLEPDRVPRLSPDELAECCSQGAIVLDGREPEAFAGGHVAGSYSVWLGGMPVFGGWVAASDSDVALVLHDDDDIEAAVMHLVRIGIDRIRGVLRGGFGSWRSSGRPVETSGIITPRQLAERRNGIQVLDVRDPDEFSSGHIPGARNVYVGTLEDELSSSDLDPARPVAVTCSVGHRAGLGASILLRSGFADVRNLIGGMKAWKELGLAIDEGDGRA